jgi:hypothetical protein
MDQIWVVHRTDDTRRAVRGTRINFSTKQAAADYVRDVCGGYGTVMSLPLYTRSPKLTDQEMKALDVKQVTMV